MNLSLCKLKRTAPGISVLDQTLSSKCPGAKEPRINNPNEPKEIGSIWIIPLIVNN